MKTSRHPVRRLTALLLTCGATTLGSSVKAANYEMKSYVQVGKTIRSAFAWCDAPDRILAVTLPSPALTGPGDVREVSLLRWLKNRPGTVGNFKYKIGLSEGAAGSTYIGLIPAGFKATRELASQNFIHLSNVQRPPEYRMGRVVQFKTMQGENPCRYVPNAAFMGATAKRTVIVWDEGDAITYTTRNFDGTPGVYITGGKKTVGVEGGITYEFNTEDGYTYRLQIGFLDPPPGAHLTVTKSGALKASERFLAYSVSIPTK